MIPVVSWLYILPILVKQDGIPFHNDSTSRVSFKTNKIFDQGDGIPANTSKSVRAHE